MRPRTAAITAGLALAMATNSGPYEAPRLGDPILKSMPEAAFDMDSPEDYYCPFYTVPTWKSSVMQVKRDSMGAMAYVSIFTVEDQHMLPSGFIQIKPGEAPSVYYTPTQAYGMVDGRIVEIAPVDKPLEDIIMCKPPAAYRMNEPFPAPKKTFDRSVRA